jgi:hypothetical protein
VIQCCSFPQVPPSPPPPPFPPPRTLFCTCRLLNPPCITHPNPHGTYHQQVSVASQMDPRRLRRHRRRRRRPRTTTVRACPFRTHVLHTNPPPFPMVVSVFFGCLFLNRRCRAVHADPHGRVRALSSNPWTPCGQWYVLSMPWRPLSMYCTRAHGRHADNRRTLSTHCPPRVHFQSGQDVYKSRTGRRVHPPPFLIW